MALAMNSDPLSISFTSSPLDVVPDEEGSSSATTVPLLSHRHPPPTTSRRTASAFVATTLAITACAVLAAAAAFAFSSFASSSASTQTRSSRSLPDKVSNLDPQIPPLRPNPHARPLAKLSRPVVVLVSSDGFRFGYQFKVPAPNIRRLIANGTEAETGLIPVFPSLTFPNHYAIATGLYPPHHGIINNWFVDPVSGALFTTSSHEPEWWLGEPIWETAVNQGLHAATYFWPGSEVKKGSWDCPEKYCRNYDGSVPFEQRVDTVLSYFDLPSDEMPSFITLYFEDPDSQGHRVGPDDPEITAAVAHIDEMIGRLISGLEHRGIFEDVTIILVGDHGMVGTCDKKLIFLDDLSPWIQIPGDWIQSITPLLAIRPTAGVSPSHVVAKMNEALSSGKIDNGKYLKIYLKEDLPERLHYAASYRIPPIIGLLEEGYKIEQKRPAVMECGGAHGYDTAFFSMRSIFVGHGPQFEKGRKVPSFQNVEIYNVIASILGLKPAANNGSSTFPSSVLLSTS